MQGSDGAGNAYTRHVSGQERDFAYLRYATELRACCGQVNGALAAVPA